VLTLLSRVRQPLNAEAIQQRLRHPALSRVTIYRVLTSLKEAALVRQIDFQQQHAYFELADPDDHHHLVCVKCKRVEDFVGCDADVVADAALRQSREFRIVTGHSFELFGLCNACGVSG
jgi:Fe2+ or Zn2+ uptake regulation protein